MATHKEKLEALDGNEAAVHVAYGLSEYMYIYPITPSSTMAERADAWAATNKLNAFGIVPQVFQLQSEGGAAASLHGCGAAGSLGSTFTSSQGLLLMIPTLYKLAGERIPSVLHIAARQVGAAGTSIFGDHSDVMAIRMTGLAMVSSASAQESMDNALACHIASIAAMHPVAHIIDGFQTSHSLASCIKIPYSDIAKLIQHDKIAEFRKTGLHPSAPHQRGTVVSRMEWMQMAEASTAHASHFVEEIEKAWEAVSQLTGRPAHKPFKYFGAPDATRVIVVMGCTGLTVEETVEAMIAEGQKVGVLRVRLFRPWSEKHFLAALPPTVKSIAVLDRTREPGASGEPLLLDVVNTLYAERPDIIVVGGRYGLGDKAFNPPMVTAIFANLDSKTPRRNFTVGINDDVSGLSLPLGPVPKALQGPRPGLQQATLWGLGSDGTVGACHMALRLLCSGAGLQVQGQFHYTAHKSGGVTMSYLRFGTSAIKAQYPVDSAGYVACHHVSYIGRYPVLSNARKGAVVVVNAPWKTAEDVPQVWRKELAKREVTLYAIDATAVAGRLSGLALTAVFLNLGVGGVIDPAKAIALLKDEARTTFAKKGEEVIAKNIKAIDAAIAGVIKIDVPQAWLSADVPQVAPLDPRGCPLPEFVTEIKTPLQRLEGDVIPVSTIEKLVPGGRVPSGTTRQEKRGIADVVPSWIPDKCVQCNLCATACPHAVIRPFLLTKQEKEKGGFSDAQVRVAQGAPGKDGYFFRIQTSPLDCTGCSVCATVCPAKALEMKPALEMFKAETDNWEFISRNVPARNDLYPVDTIKGMQFTQPLFEFSGACAGCGEAPYIKMLTQIVGERGIFACASGCNAAYAFAFGSNPYCTTPQGRGPAVAHSLFEDTAEFGYGIALAQIGRRDAYAKKIKEFLDAPESKNPELEELCKLLAAWYDTKTDVEANEKARIALTPVLEKFQAAAPAIKEIWEGAENLRKVSVWCIGGDGWANDIDFGGLEHVMSQGVEIKVLILDTEVYSNTGGQQSKSTPTGAVHKFAAGGKKSPKKDIAGNFMSTHGSSVYVATINLNANMNQALRAFREAEAFKGPAIIVAYSPCIEHGIEGSSPSTWVAQSKRATDSGYWPIYRWDPLAQELHFDGPAAIKVPLKEFLSHENRFARLEREQPERAKTLFAILEAFVTHRFERLSKIVESQKPAK